MITFKAYLTEKKDHLIDRLKVLTPEQKIEIKAFFARKPNLENKIDWNNQHLTYDDFKHLLEPTGADLNRTIKRHGIKGLREGKDYIELKVPSDFPFQAYIPLSHHVSCLLSSDKIGNSRVNLCISMIKDNQSWIHYTLRRKSVFIYLVGEQKKYVVAVEKLGKSLSGISMFDKDDNYISDIESTAGDFNIPYIRKNIVEPNDSTLEKALEIVLSDLK